MKNIEINEKQKAMLLEMCKVLFPEFNEWRYGKVTAEGNLEDFYNKTKDLLWQDREKYEQSCDFLWIEKDFKYEHDDDIERSETWVIHWFEFCMTHLVNKIQIQTNKNYLTSICGSINLVASNNSDNNYKWNHPIDYLYKEFKKLKT